MSVDSYLMPCNKSSLCRATLCNAAQYPPYLVGRMANDLDNLFIRAEDQDKTVALFDKFLNICLDFKPDRAFFRTLSELDSVLATFFPRPQCEHCHRDYYAHERRILRYHCTVRQTYSVIERQGRCFSAWPIFDFEHSLFNGRCAKVSP